MCASKNPSNRSAKNPKDGVGRVIFLMSEDVHEMEIYEVSVMSVCVCFFP